jgi:hypothetical protein
VPVEPVFRWDYLPSCEILSDGFSSIKSGVDKFACLYAFALVKPLNHRAKPAKRA